MKAKSRDGKADDLRAEYDLAVLLKDGVQGKYAARYKEGTNLIPLAPDVAKAFPKNYGEGLSEGVEPAAAADRDKAPVR